MKASSARHSFAYPRSKASTAMSLLSLSPTLRVFGTEAAPGSRVRIPSPAQAPVVQSHFDLHAVHRAVQAMLHLNVIGGEVNIQPHHG